jgi:c-di-GMP-binding flagellar brake protein YcgR
MLGAAVPSLDSNRRRHFRQSMYVRVDLRVASRGAAVPATLIDLSGGGCRVEARTMLRPRVAVEFELPRPGAPALPLTGILRKGLYLPRERTFHYAIEFDGLDAAVREALSRFVAEEQRRAIAGRGTPEMPELQRPTGPRLHARRAHPRIEINTPVRYTIGEVSAARNATAVDVGCGGIRLITGQVLRPEWNVRISMTLPASEREAGEIRVTCRPLAGVRQSRGQYIQSLAFVDPDPDVTRRIQNFVENSRLTRLRPH